MMDGYELVEHMRDWLRSDPYKPEERSAQFDRIKHQAQYMPLSEFKRAKEILVKERDEARSLLEWITVIEI